METLLENIKVECSWCKCIIKEGHEHLGISHGICEICHNEIMEELHDEE